MRPLGRSSRSTLPAHAKRPRHYPRRGRFAFTARVVRGVLGAFSPYDTDKAPSPWGRPGRATRLEPRLPFVEPLQPVVRYRLPRRRVGHVRAPARSHARVAVEGAQAHAHLPRVVGVACEQLRPAFPAEPLLEAALRVAPGLHELLAPHEAERSPVDPRLRRHSRAGPPLAARAVAVARGARGLGELEPDTAAEAAAGEGRGSHGRKSRASGTRSSAA